MQRSGSGNVGRAASGKMMSSLSRPGSVNDHTSGLSRPGSQERLHRTISPQGSSSQLLSHRVLSRQGSREEVMESTIGRKGSRENDLAGRPVAKVKTNFLGANSNTVTDVHLIVSCETQLGDKVLATGSIPAMGNWDPRQVRGFRV